MMVLEEREAVAVADAVSARVADAPPPPTAAAPRPEVHLGLTRGPTPQWNSPHGQAMRAVEATLALGGMAYFGAGLLGLLGII